MTTTNTVAINKIPLDQTDPTKTAWGSSLAAQYYFVIANGTTAAETFDAADLSSDVRDLMVQYKRGVSVWMGEGDDTVAGSAYGDTITAGDGVNRIDGGTNLGPASEGGTARDVLNVFARDQAAADALGVTALDANAAGADLDAYNQGYRIKVSNGTETDYVKNIEQVNVFLANGSYVRTVRLAVDVYADLGGQDPATMMHLAWVQGSGFNDSFNAATDIPAATQSLMTDKGRGVWIDLGAGNDTITGSGFGDDINAGTGTNFVDGGANAGSPPWGGKAQDVLHVVVANQAAADAVQVSELKAGATGPDADALAKGYTYKVTAGAETDYVKGIERISVQIDTGNGGSNWVRDIPLTVVAQEANLADTNINNYYHLAWVNGTANNDTIDVSGSTSLLSAALKDAMIQKGRGVWVDGGAGDDTITGSAYGDNFRNGAGSSKIDGGANTGGQDVFEIAVGSTAEMNAVKVEASDDPAYTWMVTYGSGSQKDYLKNVEGITVYVPGTAGGSGTSKWIPLAVQIQEIRSTDNLDASMHYAWAQGTSGNDTVNAADISSTTKGLMSQHGRGFWAETGAGNDTITGSGFGDDINAGTGTNFVDGGANAGSPPWGGKAQDVLHVVVANQAAADAVQVTELKAGATGPDADALANGYTYKVTAGAETDYVKGIERISVQIDTGNGGSNWVRDIPLTVVAQEANLADTNINNYYHLAWVNGTANNDSIDLSGDSALLSAPLKAAMTQKGRGIWVDGGAGDDTVTGSAYGDNFRNGAGNSKIDGGANTGGQDVFEIAVGSTAEMNAVKVEASDDPAYTWMVSYGSGTQKDYLKNIEAITVNVTGTNTGKWIPLTLQVQEIAPTDKLDAAPYYAWAQGTTDGDSFDANAVISASTRTLMDQHGRGVWVDLGAGDDIVTGSAYGDDITAGSGTNYVDGGTNAGTMPGGAAGADRLEVYVANQAQADAVTMTTLTSSSTGADGAAFAAGYRYKVTNGSTEIDYVKNVEQVAVTIWNDKDGDGLRDGAPQNDPANELTTVRTLGFAANSAPTFNGAPAGVAVYDAGSDFGLLGATVLTNGKMIGVSYLGDAVTGAYALLLVRANADGSTDTSFGGGTGAVTLPIAYGTALAPVVQADGKIVIGSRGAAGELKVTRVNADGSLDTGFGTGGSTSVAVGTSGGPTKLLVDAAGKLVLVGVATNANNNDMLVIRLNANGSLDTGFNGSGKLLLAPSAGHDGAQDGVLQADGKLLIAGSTTGADGTTDWAVLRLNQDGSTDTTFGNAGKTVLSFGAGAETAYAIQTTGGGKILVAGLSRGAGTDSDQTLARLNADGTLDTSFGTNGKAQVHLSDKNEFVKSMLVQADGKIVVLGSANGDTGGMNGYLTVTRYNADGSLDTGFGSGGTARQSVHGVGDTASSLALVGGKIVVFGSSYNDSSFNTSNVIYRLNADGSLDTSFAPNPVSSLGGTVRSNGVEPVVLDNNVSIYDADLAGANYGGASLTLVRHGGASADDIFGGTGDVSFAGGKITVGTTTTGTTVIGTAVKSGGTLTLNFSNLATQGLVNRVLHGITYKNGSATPPDQVTIDWTFSDGNNGDQGAGGAKSASGSTVVEIGVYTYETVRNAADPTKATTGQTLATVSYLATVYGTARGDSVDGATGFSAAAKGLMDQFKHGAYFDMGAGDDTVTGTGYSDQFTMGTGVNRVDGGANAGNMPEGTPGRDFLTVYVGSDAEGAAVSATLLNAASTGTDAAAFAAGYDVKVVNGAETDYLKNVELVRIYKWADANGNGVRDSGEISWVREIALAMRVNETAVSTTNPNQSTGGQALSSIWHMANVQGWDRDDNFNAATDVSAAAQALMAQQGRGVWVDSGAGNDTIVGSAYGDNFIGGDGINRIDGGANVGSTPNAGQHPYDILEVYARSEAQAKAVQAIALSAGMEGADGAAFAAGYAFKVVNGSETDYVKNVEGVNVFTWNDANNNGARDSGETVYVRQIALSAMVNEVSLSPTNPGQDAGGNPLSTYGQLAWATGGAGDDRFDANADVSAGTRALMAQFGRGVSADTGAGNDTVIGSAYGDYFVLGAGINRLDGGANGGTDTIGNPARDVLDVYVANQAAADATTVVALTSGMTGEDGTAYADGYRYKISNGTVETDYVKNLEQLNIQIWNDKDGDGQRDYGTNNTDPANEVTYVKGVTLATNTAPAFGAPAGMGIVDAGYDLTPTGVVTLANGKTLVVAMMDQVDDGYNYVLTLLSRNADGTADTSFGNGTGQVLLPTYFGGGGTAAVQADGKIVIAVSSSPATNSDFKIVRFNPNGSLDTSFGSNGETVVALGPMQDLPVSVLMQADGRIVVTGTVIQSSTDRDFGVVRLNTDGSLDTSYNGSGKLVISLSAGRDVPAAAKLDAQGRLLIAGSGLGTANFDTALVRVNTDGSLDTAFAGGRVFLPTGSYNDYANTMTVLSTGKILLAGDFAVQPNPTLDTGFALVRLNADGTSDTTFGTGGKVNLNLGGTGDRIERVLEQADGKILASGWTNGTSSNGGQMVVARFNADGSVDASFGSGGMVRIPLLAIDSRSAGLAIVDGKIVVTGATTINTGFDASLVLVRLNADGSFDSSYNPVPGGSLGSTVHGDGIHPVVLDANAVVYDAELAGRGNYGGATLTLSRHGGASADDHFTSAGNDVSFNANNLSVGGTSIGWVEQAGGTLSLHFYGNATQALVTRALHGIAYTNSAANPGASVSIDWQFADNNGGDQGFGGALTGSGNTVVQLGVTSHDVVRAYADASSAADSRPLANINFFSTVDGTAGADTVSAANVSGATRGLMDEFKRGIEFDLGAGDDTATGSAYSDWFALGSGTNHADGGANAGNVFNDEGRDMLIVYARSQAEANAVTVTRLESGMSGADADAFTAGYEAKVVNGSEIDYIKHIENIDIHLWTDSNGNGYVDGAEGAYLRSLEFRVHVGEIQVSATDSAQTADGHPLAEQWNFAWANGTGLNDSFNATTDIPAGTQTLMAQYHRGVWADLGAGNDHFTGTAYNDTVVAGTGTNWIDGGTNSGTGPDGQPLRDTVEIYVGNQAELDAVQLVALTGTLTGLDATAQAAGYQYKIVAGTETDYVKGVEQYSVSIWNDKDGDGLRDFSGDATNEVTGTVYTQIPDAAAVGLVGVPPVL